MQPKQPRVLVVEDEPSARELIADILDAAGYQVEIAEDGPTALTQLDAEPDLLLLDVMLPGLDGFEVCRRLRAQEGERHVPVIMLTALSSDSQRHAGFAAGADDYLTKPFNTQELVDRVQVWVAARQRVEEAHARRSDVPSPDAGGAAGASPSALAEVALQDESLLHYLVAEATRRPGFLAAVLMPYARTQGWDDAALAQALGCSPATLPRLLLRARPLPRSWDTDVALLAQACSADPAAVGATLAAAEAWEQARA